MTDLTTKTDAEPDAEIAALMAEKERRVVPSEEAFALLADVLEACGFSCIPKEIRNGNYNTEDIAVARLLQAALDAARGEPAQDDDGWIYHEPRFDGDAPKGYDEGIHEAYLFAKATESWIARQSPQWAQGIRYRYRVVKP